MCTSDDTTNTGINIETVKLSKLKPQDIIRLSESIHVNRCNETGILLNPTSKNARNANIVVIITQLDVIICDPFTPTFLPKNPDIIEPNKGNIIIDRYIIYFL